MQLAVYTFPFGRPVLPCPASANGPRRLFILGAYPSALYVAWRPPVPYRRIQAIAVDNEPEPFWKGGREDELRRIGVWKAEVGYSDERFGHVGPAGRLNGSSGTWVDANVIGPLEGSREDAWITDCLDTYCASNNIAARIKDTYSRFADAHAGLALPTRLEPNKAYGQPIAVRVNDRDATWWPLAHPAAPVAYQDAHKEWLLRCPRATPTAAVRPP